jgi:hypothetical protein
MKLKFKTVKEFLELIHENDFSFLEHYDLVLYDYVCFRFDQHSIAILVYNSEIEDFGDGSDLVDTIYGTFFTDGGTLDLYCDNTWSIPFTITDEEISLGTIYKLKIQPPKKTPIPEPIPFIEL